MLNEGQEILEKHYKVIKKIGNGAFASIYSGMPSYHLHPVEKQRTKEILAAKVVSNYRVTKLGKRREEPAAGHAFLGKQTHPQAQEEK